MSVRTRRKRAGDSLLGLSIRLTASLLTIILVGDVFPFALLIYTDFRAEILVYWGVGGLVASPVAFTFFLRRYFKKAGPLTGNSRDEWTALVNVFAAVFQWLGSCWPSHRSESSL